MKKMLIASALAIATSVCWAQAMPQGPGQGRPDLNTVKTHILGHIEQRMQMLQQSQSCVQAATSFAQLRQCRPPRPEGRQGFGQSQGQMPGYGAPMGAPGMRGQGMPSGQN